MNMFRGATQMKATIGSKLIHWRQHHARVARESLVRLLMSPVSTLMTVLVIAIALSMPAGLAKLLMNAQQVAARWDGNPQISLYMQQGATPAEQQTLLEAVKGTPGVLSATLISPEQALDEFRQLSGYGEAVDLLGHNPLPALISIEPAGQDPKELQALRDRLAGLTGVDSAELDMAWLARLRAILEFGERLLATLFVGFLMAVLLVVVNTIRLAIESRRDEIVTVKMLGATNAFVRRPFLYMGFWSGLLGGLLAAIFVTATLFWLNEPLTELARLYQAPLHIEGLTLREWFVIPAFSAVLGLIGAWFAVRRHLRALEPR